MTKIQMETLDSPKHKKSESASYPVKTLVPALVATCIADNPSPDHIRHPHSSFIILHPEGLMEHETLLTDQSNATHGDRAKLTIRHNWLVNELNRPPDLKEI